MRVEHYRRGSQRGALSYQTEVSHLFSQVRLTSSRCKLTWSWTWVHCLCMTYLSSLFNLLLLSVPLLHVPHEQTLTEELLGTARRLDVQKGIVGIFNHALPECANAKLDHGSVVQDLDDRKQGLSIHLGFTVALLFRFVYACRPVRAGQHAGCCPAGGSLASGRGPGTSESAERGGRCGRGWRMCGYGQCDPWRRWICRDGPWSRRCPLPRSPPGPARTMADRDTWL